MKMFDVIRTHLFALPTLVKFAIGMAVIVSVPRFARRIYLPAGVSLLLMGVVVGPHVLDLVHTNAPIADFFGDLGKLMLMFFSGLEINLALFKRTRVRSMTFGLITTTIPLLLGTIVALWLGYPFVPSVVVGSLLASHTLLGSPIVMQLGVNRLEPVAITIGATMVSDTLSLIVFAICVPTFVSGFSVSGLVVQLIKIIVLIPLILFGISRLGAYFLKMVEDEEGAYFVLLLAILAVSAVLAQLANLPGIVGAFLAGLAVNSAVRDKPAKGKLEFLGNSLFIPIFFIVTGFLIDPIVFGRSIVDNFSAVAGLIVALLIGKAIAVAIVGRAFNYSPAAQMTMWSLTLPQVAATLAATLVAYSTFNSSGQRLLDQKMLNAVLVLVLFTSVLGPILTQHYAPLMLKTDSNDRPGVAHA